MSSGCVRRGFLAATALCLALSAGERSMGQEASPSDAKPAASEFKFRGRLPAYYKAVVSESQRREIYSIQRGYAEKIHALQSQIMQMTRQRDKEVEAVLSDEQRQRVEQLIAEAKARRTGRRPDAGDDPGEESGEATEGGDSTE